MSFDIHKWEYCRELIERKLGWGDNASWQHRDFQQLRQLILKETNVDLSESTLRRMWGKVKYQHLPSITTLDTLARFAGYESWRKVLPGVSTETVASHANNRINKKYIKNILWAVALLVVSLIIVLLSFDITGPVVHNNYSFASRPVTRSIPNTVIFDYDASSSPSDSVFIQQSWDSRRKALVNKYQRQYTSVYYEPGFYSAKLLVGDKVVREHPLLIPTDGWLALIDRSPVPVYLNSSEYNNDTTLKVPIPVIGQYNIPLQPDPPVVKFFNVGNFSPVEIEAMSFEAEIKNEYKAGTAACQATEIALITDGVPVTIPLADSGCVSELNLVSTGEIVSGRYNDLSGFGVDFSRWVKVGCKADNGSINYFINGKRVYTSAITSSQAKIVGIACYFAGTGAVKNIRLLRDGQTVFSSF